MGFLSRFLGSKKKVNNVKANKLMLKPNREQELLRLLEQKNILQLKEKEEKEWYRVKIDQLEAENKELRERLYNEPKKVEVKEIKLSPSEQNVYDLWNSGVKEIKLIAKKVKKKVNNVKVILCNIRKKGRVLK